MADPGFLKEWGGGADLTERYRNPRENRLSDSLVPFLNFKLKRSKKGGLATQSTPLNPALGISK